MNRLLLAGIAVLLLILDLGLRSMLSFGTIMPSLTLPFAVFVSLRKDAAAGTIAGFLLGLGLDVFGGSALGSSALAMSIAGFLPGRLWQGGPFRVHWPWGIALLISAILFEAIRHTILSRELAVTFGTLFITSGLPSAVYTTLLGVLWFLSPLNRDRSA